MATPDRTPTAAASMMLSLKPPRKQQRFPPWLRPAAAAAAAGQGLARGGLSLLRGAATEGEDEEEMYEYEDGEGEEYDGEEDLDRWVDATAAGVQGNRLL